MINRWGFLMRVGVPGAGYGVAGGDLAYRGLIRIVQVNLLPYRVEQPHHISNLSITPSNGLLSLLDVYHPQSIG